MRKLAWAALGFAAASFLAEYVLPVSGLPQFAAALVLLSGAAFFLRGKARKRALIAALAAAVGLFSWWVHYERHVMPCEALAGQSVTLRARVTDHPSEKESSICVYVRVLDGAPAEKGALYFYGDADMPSLRPGDIILAEVRLSSVTEVDGEMSTCYTADNINLIGFSESAPTVVGRSGMAWIYFPKNVARAIKNTCDRLFPADTAPFIKGLLTGDTEDLRENAGTYSHMKAAGVLHVVAVSGMHLFVLTAFIQLIFGKGRGTNLVCLPVIVVFVFMTGCTPSVIRAAVMQSISLLAPVLHRENDGITGIMGALLLILVLNPMAVGGVGLQLSFLCVMGYCVLLPALGEWVKRRNTLWKEILGFGADNVRCSVCAQAFSLPAAACYFGTVPVLSPLANLLTLPVVELCFAGGYAVCTIGMIFPAVGSALAWALSWAARWCLFVYDRIASVPWGCLYTDSPWVIVWLVWLYAVMVVWLFLREKKIHIRFDIPVMLVVIGLCAALMLSVEDTATGESTLAVLDVGQGACTALTDADSAVVIDCGGSGLDSAGDVAADYLCSRGRDRVDVLVLTHLHEDHTDGVENLLARMPVGMIVLPCGADDADDSLRELLSAAESAGTEVVQLKTPCRVRLGDIVLSLYLPQAETDENERGIVVLAEMSGRSALIMGDGGDDAELSLLEAGCLADVDVLVAGHHGSKTASTALFLRAIQAETAVVSVGRNSYGQPAEETMERLFAYCDEVYRTDENGSVIIQMKANEISYG